MPRPEEELIELAALGDKQGVLNLLRHGPSLDYFNDFQQSAIGEAWVHRRKSVLQILLEEIADKNVDINKSVDDACCQMIWNDKDDPESVLIISAGLRKPFLIIE